MIIRLTCFTPNPERWEVLASALGGTKVLTTDLWRLYSLGAGRLGIHSVPSESPVAGSCAITLEVPDLDEYLAHARPKDAELSIGDTRHGRAITVTSPSLPTFFIDPIEGEVTHSGETVAAPLFYTEHVPAAANLLASLGLEPHLSSEAGTWADLTSDGIAAVHHGKPGYAPSFEHPDLDQLSENLRAASIRATLIDETFGRTLRVEHPDDPSTAAEIWINEPQTDLYGYRQGLPTAR